MNGRPVAIAAVGVVCGLGRTADELARALREHRSGAGPIREPAFRAFGSGQAVEVSGSIHEPADFPDDRKVALLVAAVEQALAAAPEVSADRRGVFLGTGLSSATPREIEEDIYPHVHAGRVDRDSIVFDLDDRRVAPRRHLPERATAWVRARWGARGPSGTAFSACAAGAEAIAAGARAIARGDADVVLAGGHDAMIHPLGILSFQVLGALSNGVGRPFDRRRDGFLIGEGAAVLRLEPLETCATPLAILRGAGSSLDAWGVTAPHPEGAGAELAMRRALADARIEPDAVGWVNAHATATPLGDAAEAAAIRRLFGDRVLVSSLKGAIGHTLAAAGAIEAAATVLALKHRFVPGTVGCEEPDDLGITVQRGVREGTPGIVVSNSFGFGGQNCSLVFGPLPGDLW